MIVLKVIGLNVAFLLTNCRRKLIQMMQIKLWCFDIFYNRKNFNLSKKDAGLIASLFGLMNLFSHASGGFLSDIGNEKMGIHVQLKRGGGSIGDAVFAAVFKKFPQSSMSFTILGILIYGFYGIC
uniref:Uncharacterized protein n=1 Tax=Rhizophagus irregularis (strain DAOM 181602 / DAOM 197198 / MUCL 43194) TaxID=747089 RepID=U9TQ09_RHIID